MGKGGRGDRLDWQTLLQLCSSGRSVFPSVAATRRPCGWCRDGLPVKRATNAVCLRGGICLFDDTLGL